MAQNEEISYERVVTLEVPDYAQHPDINYSVKYKRGRQQTRRLLVRASP